VGGLLPPLSSGGRLLGSGLGFFLRAVCRNAEQIPVAFTKNPSGDVGVLETVRGVILSSHKSREGFGSHGIR